MCVHLLRFGLDFLVVCLFKQVILEDEEGRENRYTYTSHSIPYGFMLKRTIIAQNTHLIHACTRKHTLKNETL